MAALQKSVRSVSRCLDKLCAVNARNLSSAGEKNWEPEEKTTHTGQKWSEEDYRLVRFIDKPKQVNERFAIDLIAQVPPQPVKSRTVACDGGDGPLGHPKVYINLDQPGNHACGYCGLRFYKDDAH